MSVWLANCLARSLPWVVKKALKAKCPKNQIPIATRSSTSTFAVAVDAYDGIKQLMFFCDFYRIALYCNLFEVRDNACRYNNY